MVQLVGITKQQLEAAGWSRESIAEFRRTHGTFNCVRYGDKNGAIMKLRKLDDAIEFSKTHSDVPNLTFAILRQLKGLDRKAIKDKLRENDNYKRDCTERGIIKTPEQLAKEREEQRIRREISDKVEIALKFRQTIPSRVALYLGPTNSGKTYHALKMLEERGHGVYACPLRMLAREAYDTLRSRLGDEKVGLLTGEEQINPGADIICCTAEVAPQSGELLVLDETQWVHDEERGYAWTRLLVGAEYDELEITANLGAEGFLLKTFTDYPHLEINKYDRLTPLSFGGQIDLKHIPARSLLVAFSRKGVIALAKRLQKDKRKVGVLYGTLPPGVRLNQIRKFIDGEFDILVTTDLIGHGVNLPTDNVVFSQTEKYDGFEHRELELWEAAQIAGRAGRYKLSTQGKVYYLTGEDVGFNPNKILVRQAAAAAAGKRSDELFIEKALIRPRASDLSTVPPQYLGLAFSEWFAHAEEVLHDHPTITPMPMVKIIERFELMKQFFAKNIDHFDDAKWPLNFDETWQFSVLPIDVDKNADTFELLLADYLQYLPSNAQAVADRFVNEVEINTEDYGLEQLETISQISRDLLLAANSIELFKPVMSTARKLEELAADRIAESITTEIRRSSFGRCSVCGGKCAPWFQKCEKCFSTKGRH